MGMKKTGNIELLGELGDKVLWSKIIDNTIMSIQGDAWVDLESGKRGRALLLISHVIPKGKVPIDILYQSGIDEIHRSKQSNYNISMNQALVNIFKGMIPDCYLFIGHIILKSKIVHIAILYFERFDQFLYSTLNLDQKKSFEQFAHHMN